MEMAKVESVKSCQKPTSDGDFTDSTFGIYLKKCASVEYSWTAKRQAPRVLCHDSQIPKPHSSPCLLSANIFLLCLFILEYLIRNNNNNSNSNSVTSLGRLILQSPKVTGNS